MLLNFLTPASVNSGVRSRTRRAPTTCGSSRTRRPIQTDWYVEGEQLVDFKIDFLNKIPLIWLVFAVVLIIGAIYYFAVQRKKPYEAVVAPTDEDLSGIVSV